MRVALPRRVLLRLAWRHSRRRPLQSLFLVVGVAIGVAMIVAIDLANGSANRAFALGAQQITGRATHQVVGGPDGVDASFYSRLRRELGFRLSAPVLESYVTVPRLDAQPMRLLGIDPFAEPPFRSYLGGDEQTNSAAAADGFSSFITPFLLEPKTVLIGQSVADHYNLRPGQSLPVRIGARTEELSIVGLLVPSNELSRRALEGLLIVDISTAQEILGRVGRLDRIDLIVPSGADGVARLEEIRGLLPPGAQIIRPSARTATVAEMTAAFRLNLTALSLLALVVGMFLIYNTVSFSVVQRRPVLGILRALGMTRRELFFMILIEAASLGLIGTGLGLGLGVLLGRGAVQAVTQTINDLFFVVAVRSADIPIWTLAKGAFCGIGAALLAALLPALEATSVPPAGAVLRSSIEQKARRALPRPHRSRDSPWPAWRGPAHSRMESRRCIRRSVRGHPGRGAGDASTHTSADGRRTPPAQSPLWHSRPYGASQHHALAFAHVRCHRSSDGRSQCDHWRGGDDRLLPADG